MIPFGATWRYLDNGSNQGTAWRASTFVDDSWATGPAELGYGDGDEATVVSFGGDSNNKYTTTYFRRAFEVNDAAQFAGLRFQIIRDDGAVVYLNGTEVFRSNMPAGVVTYTTFASSALNVPAESTPVAAGAAAGLLVEGRNVVTVEIHQANLTSTDISFDLELRAGPPVVTRGPYLQDGTTRGVVIRWRTDQPTNSRVRVGTSREDLSGIFDNAGVVTEHVVTVRGL